MLSENDLHDMSDTLILLLVNTHNTGAQLETSFGFGPI